MSCASHGCAISNTQFSSAVDARLKAPLAIQQTTYRQSGVDIDRAEALVRAISPIARSTYRPEVVGDIGGFSGAFRMPQGYEKPLLMATTDGVGTKLKIAIEEKDFSTIGIDLVAMCANDLIVSGTEPLFFLDYYSAGELGADTPRMVIESIAAGCRMAGCALIGGETAEMPGMYQQHDFDLAGFCVGVVEEEKIIDGSRVRAGDVLIGLPSSGLHANGYSLIRHIVDKDPRARHALRDHLLVPTRIYVQTVRAALRQVAIKAICHITGGGIIENLPRVLPAGLAAACKRWEKPQIFQQIKSYGDVSGQEMLRVFNCGIGMVLMVSPEDQEQAMNVLTAECESPVIIGEIISCKDGEPRITVDW